MHPLYADFSVDPPRLGNTALLAPGDARPDDKAAFASRPCLHFGGNHVKLDAGGRVTLAVDAGAAPAFDEATLTVTALASKRGPRPGHAPLSITVNGRTVVAGWTIPGGGDLPQQMTFAIPAAHFRPGPDNRIEIANARDAATFMWLYRITLEEVFDRGAGDRALAAETARAAVLTYSTEVGIAGSTRWTTGPQLHVYIERGEQSVPAQLSWTDASGTEAAISFSAALEGVHGYRRASDGTTTQLRGRLRARTEYPDGIEPGRLLHFTDTAEEWGGTWHRSGPLRLMLVHGEHAPHRITWRDQRGNSGSISLEPDGAGFLGYYQRYNEGAIGYRGRLGTDSEKY